MVLAVTRFKLRWRTNGASSSVCHAQQVSAPFQTLPSWIKMIPDSLDFSPVRLSAGLAANYHQRQETHKARQRQRESSLQVNIAVVMTLCCHVLKGP